MDTSTLTLAVFVVAACIVGPALVILWPLLPYPFRPWVVVDLFTGEVRARCFRRFAAARSASRLGLWHTDRMGRRFVVHDLRLGRP